MDNEANTSLLPPLSVICFCWLLSHKDHLYCSTMSSESPDTIMEQVTLCSAWALNLQHELKALQAQCPPPTSPITPTQAAASITFLKTAALLLGPQTPPVTHVPTKHIFFLLQSVLLHTHLLSITLAFVIQCGSLMNSLSITCPLVRNAECGAPP